MAHTVKQVEDELLSISMNLLAFTTVLSVVDVSSDFIQGYLLYQDPDLWKFGILTFVINWLPGVIASIHLLTNQGRELGFAKTLIGCGKIFNLEGVIVGFPGISKFFDHREFDFVSLVAHALIC